MKVEKQQQVKPSAGSIVGGAVCGGVVCKMSNKLAGNISFRLMQQMKKVGASLTFDEFNTVANAIDDTLNTTGLAQKGVELLKFKPSSLESFKICDDALMQSFNKIPVLKKLPQGYKKYMSRILSGTFSSGNNAAYMPKIKKILLPENILPAAFHEMGHAANANLGKLGKVLFHSRSLKLLTLPIALIAILKTKKPDGQKPQGTADKITTFIKENAGKLTFATSVPVIIEEGLASIKGQGFAKKVLSPELAKKVAKTNAIGFTTYVLTALASAAAIAIAVRIKDRITDNSVAVKQAKLLAATPANQPNIYKMENFLASGGKTAATAAGETAATAAGETAAA